jgi:hypothetical protein
MFDRRQQERFGEAQTMRNQMVTNPPTRNKGRVSDAKYAHIPQD